jgi:hypothetical protein
VPPCKKLFLHSYFDYVYEHVKNFTNKYVLVSIYKDSKYRMLSTLDQPINMGMYLTLILITELYYRTKHKITIVSDLDNQLLYF